MPPIAECSVSISNEMISVRSSLTKTTSEASHSNRVPQTDPAWTTLLRLPTEIILDLASYLPLSSYMSLSYSCRTIRKKMDASITHLLGGTALIRQSSASTLSVEVRNICFLERWELLCMLNRDEKPPLSKTFCGQCEQAHKCSGSSKNLSTQVVKERHCPGTAGLVWICPRQILEYGQATSSMTGESHRCESIASYIGGTRCSRRAETGICLTSWPIMRVVPNSVPSSEEVNEALSSLNAPVCPHLRLNDAHVANAYSQDRQLRRWRKDWRDTAKDCQRDIYTSEPPLIVICHFCSTEVQFKIRAECYGPETLYVTILRRVTEIRSCKDRAWICHVADPADFEEYTTAWQASVAECRRKVGLVFYP